MQIWLHTFLTGSANLMSAKRESHLVPVFIKHISFIITGPSCLVLMPLQIRMDEIVEEVLAQVTPISNKF